MRILGLDIGEKRIGVAKADSRTRIAVPVGFVNVDGSEWLEIAKIARMQNVQYFILGLPRSNEGRETAQSQYVKKVAEVLKKNIPEARIRFQDESLTSVLAEDRLKQRGKPYQKGDIDAEAATIILQDFLESFTAREMTEEEQKGEKEQKEIIKELEVKKKKKTRKWITGVSIVIALGVIGTGGALMLREKIRADRQAEYERIEQEMKPEVFSFTIRPGETIFDVKKALAEVGYSDSEIEEAFSANYDFDFLASRPVGASLEGFLFGETYEFYKSDSVETILTRFLEKMGQVIADNNLIEAYNEQGLSLYEGVTLASIVAKEASSPEQPTVAQVFLKRLSYGIPLGSDVTVSYALDVIDPDRQTYTNNQSALKVDSCYNTRLYAGLPCGPISNPGLSALIAVANPSDTSYLYFLTGDDGMMYYSYTEAEHNQKIRSYCQNLCNTSL